jgi:predicted small lipoprotein YifL
MRSPTLGAAVTLAVAMSLALAGCGPAGSTPDPKASTMTPDQAHEQLKSDLFAVAEAAIPAGTPVVEEEGRDVPCGGPAGTDPGKVRSSVFVSNGDPALTRTAEELARAAAARFGELGWRTGPVTANTHGAVLVAASKDGFGAEFGATKGAKNIKVGGNTPCLDNPDR